MGTSRTGADVGSAVAAEDVRQLYRETEDLIERIKSAHTAESASGARRADETITDYLAAAFTHLVAGSNDLRRAAVIRGGAEALDGRGGQ